MKSVLIKAMKDFIFLQALVSRIVDLQNFIGWKGPMKIIWSKLHLETKPTSLASFWLIQFHYSLTFFITGVLMTQHVAYEVIQVLFDSK